MKSTVIFGLVAFLGMGGQTLASVSQSDVSRLYARETCGDLGVIDIRDVPEGVNRNEVRMCDNHPLGAVHQTLHKRDCWFDAPVGCSKGYCWKTCGARGSGKWCWTAENEGYGDWISCNTDEDCSAAAACGVGGKDCTACGCDC